MSYKTEGISLARHCNSKSEILSTHTLALKFPGTCGESSNIVQ